MADGVGTGIGIGIGEGLHGIAEGLRTRYKKQSEERDKQAEALHNKALTIGGNLIKSGYKVAMDPQSNQPILIDQKTGSAVDAPNEDVGSMYKGYLDTLKQARELYPPHESGALVDHFRKFIGKPAQPAKPDPRAAQFDVGSASAEIPLPAQQWQIDKDAPVPFKAANGIVYQSEINPATGQRRWQPAAGVSPRDIEPQAIKDQRAAGLSDEEITEASRIKAGLDPKATAQKPRKAPTVKEVGGATVITDVETGTDYGNWNINTAPPEIKGMYEGVEKDKKAKADAAEDKELRRVKAAEESQARVFAHQDEMMVKRLEDAYSRADHAEANAIRKGADTRYNAALSLSAFADEAKANVSAAKDKLLAGRLIRESEGRFNPAQYDNLVKNAGLANTFSQWLESAETGQLTDKVRDQLVDAAHALLSSAKTAVDSLPKDGGGKPSKDDQVEDLEFGPDGKLRPVKKK